MKAQGRPLRAIAEVVRAGKGVQISHEGVAGVLRSRAVRSQREASRFT